MTHKWSKTLTPWFDSTLLVFDLTSNHHIHLKYRYSIRGRFEYSTIRPTIRPRIMPEYQIFFELQGGVELFAEVCQRSI